MGWIGEDLITIIGERLLRGWCGICRSDTVTNDVSLSYDMLHDCNTAGVQNSGAMIKSTNDYLFS
jgi:hypothetical protein